MDTPLLSIILPSFNRARVLRRAIESVLRQEERAIELILVDDGSQDETPDLVRSIADSRLRYLRFETNRGGNFARNRAIEAARAPIISFLDSDDEFLPHKVTRVLDFFARHPKIAGLVDSHQLFYEDGRPARDVRNPDDLDPENFRRRLFQGTLAKPTPAISASRDALIAVGLFDETLRRRQDMDLLARLSRRYPCASIAEILWKKHWVAGAISADRGNFIDALLAILDRHPEYSARDDYKIGLERDIVRHFAELAAGFEGKALWRDFFRLRQDGRIGCPALSQWPRGWRIFCRRLIAFFRQSR